MAYKIGVGGTIEWPTVKSESAGIPFGQVFFFGDSDDRYPHRCPRCSGPAYVGLQNVDCRTDCR